VIEHSSGFSLAEALDDQSLDACRSLIAEYGRMLPAALQPREIDSLPGDYARPRGRLLLARIAGEPAGCVALRPLGGTEGEMKRLFVRPDYRGMGVGRMLAECAIDEARAIGYSALKLDTLARMTQAREMYAALGFEECPPYNDNPVPGVTFMKLALLRTG
jgi:GNAT superfamily N-acetyltransferase